MKLWFRFALVCLAIVCLLLSLGQQAGSNYQLPVARSGPGLDRCRESASATAAVGKIMEFHPARAGPLESLVLDCALTVSNIGPPYLETHGPPGQWNLRGLGELLVKPATQRQKPTHRATFLHSPRNFRPSTHQTEESRFCTRL